MLILQNKGENMKIGIIGLGLIGGSIYKDLMRLGYDVAAVSQSQSGDNIFESYDVLKIVIWFLFAPR